MNTPELKTSTPSTESYINSLDNLLLQEKELKDKLASIKDAITNVREVIVSQLRAEDKKSLQIGDRRFIRTTKNEIEITNKKDFENFAHSAGIIRTSVDTTKAKAALKKLPEIPPFAVMKSTEILSIRKVKKDDSVEEL